MKKSILIVILMLLILFSVLSTTGIETSRFNSLVEEKVSSEKNINVVLNTIRFKINLKELDLFLETQNPEITYKESSIPINNLKVFIDFLSFLKSDPKIKKIRLSTTELDITQLNQLSFIKPSNFKSLLHNKIKEGKLISEIEIFFSNKGKLDDFIAKGEVKDFKLEIFNNLIFNNANLNFIADKNDILIKNINGDLEDIKISKGDIKLNLEKGLNLSSNFKSEFSFDKKLLNKYSKFINQKKFIENINIIKTTLNNNISINLDKTYKLKNYDYKISGTVHKSEFDLSKIIKNK